MSYSYLVYQTTEEGNHEIESGQIGLMALFLLVSYVEYEEDLTVAISEEDSPGMRDIDLSSFIEMRHKLVPGA